MNITPQERQGLVELYRAAFNKSCRVDPVVFDQAVELQRSLGLAGPPPEVVNQWGVRGYPVWLCNFKLLGRAVGEEAAAEFWGFLQARVGFSLDPKEDPSRTPVHPASKIAVRRGFGTLQQAQERLYEWLAERWEGG